MIHVIKEYHFLKDVLFLVPDKSHDITKLERDIILYYFDLSIQYAGEVFYQVNKNKEVEAKKKAEKKTTKLSEEDELRDEFVEILVHDLKNPINTALTGVGFLQKNLTEKKGSTPILMDNNPHPV